MTFSEFALIVKDVGISAVLCGMLFWFCFWIVKYIVTNMCSTLTLLNSNMQLFTVKVADDHRNMIESFDRHNINMVNLIEKHQGNADIRHEKIMAEHDEMLKALGRINGYKE